MTTARRALAAVLFLSTSVALAADTADLFRAAQHGDADALWVALATGSDPNAANADGMTALHIAAWWQQPEAVRPLLAVGADVHARDRRGRTPLHYAALGGEKHTVELLLATGANVNAVDAQGETPLHLAARRFKTRAAETLLAAGADVRARNSRGQTPLHVLGSAARDDDGVAAEIAALAELLIQHGADPAAADDTGARAWPREPVPGERQPSGYPPYDTGTGNIAQLLLDKQTAYPAICRRYDLGPTVQNRRIYALKITDNLDVEEDEPEFRWVANMHGDEVVGLMMTLNLIDYLLTNYGTDPRVTNLVDNLEIWIVPSMNPDGYQLVRRANASGVDLNRNFPEGYVNEPNTTTGRAPETAAIMNMAFARSFTLSANLHGGALVVNYPFDNNGLGSTYSPTPDEDLFVYISEQYSRSNPPMWNSTEFPHGITNGAAWYSITGGLQDWSYRYMGCNDVTIELGNTKTPAFSTIPTYWSQNREAMLAYMETAFIGVRGIVTDAATGQPLAATVQVVGRDHNVYTDPDVGDYHRMLLPGSYQLRFTATGFDPLVVPVTVAAGAATRLDVALVGPPFITYPDGGEMLTVNQPVTITWQGAATARFQVQTTANYGDLTVTTDGFERTTLGPDYTTGGNLPWVTATGTVHGGTYAARAGAITHNQQTWMQRSTGPGTLSFWYRVSSEANYDWFNFYIDGTLVIHASGTTGSWTQYTTALGPGTHVLKWEYVKDYSISSGSDTVWVDDLQIVDDHTVWTTLVEQTEPGVLSALWTPAQASTACKVRVRANAGGGQYGAWDESNGVFTVAAGPQWPRGDMNCSGAVDFDDIDPFVLALSGEAAYAAEYADCRWLNADCNGDGAVDFDDIDAFVAAIGR